MPLVGGDRAAERLDEGRFAGAVVADHGKDLVRQEVEIGVVEGNDAAVALDEAARLQDRGDVVAAHAEIFLIHWSIETAMMMRTPTVKSCQRSLRPASARPLRKIPTMSAPMSVPMI